MKKIALLFIAIVALLTPANQALCGSDVSYEDTVALIKNTMSTSTSVFRKESYGYIHFDNCRLNYSVSGTYPVGSTYDIKYSNLDFSRLNPEQSKISHDYTAFLTLNFKDYLEYKPDHAYEAPDETLKIRTVVINGSDDEAIQTLFKAFMHLGELCSAGKGR